MGGSTMTDAHLMDADCIHGNTWWECVECWADCPEIPDEWPRDPNRPEYEG